MEYGRRGDPRASKGNCVCARGLCGAARRRACVQHRHPLVVHLHHPPPAVRARRGVGGIASRAGEPRAAGALLGRARARPAPPVRGRRRGSAAGGLKEPGPCWQGRGGAGRRVKSDARINHSAVRAGGPSPTAGGVRVCGSAMRGEEAGACP